MNLNKTAKYISYLFIPPAMNFFIFIFLSTYLNDYRGILTSFIFGLSLPLVVIYYLRKKGKLSDNNATIKEERNIPYIYAIVFSFLGVCLSAYLKLNPFLIMLWMVYLYCSIIILKINQYWKISAHALGAAIPLGALIVIGEKLPIIVSIVLLILISISRIILKVHTKLQVILGAILGLIVSYTFLFYFLHY